MEVNDKKEYTEAPTKKKIKKIIGNMKTNRSEIMTEHLKYGGETLRKASPKELINLTKMKFNKQCKNSKS